MLKYVQGDLFTSPAKVLVNTVNTQGVMGKGIALTFKRAYPDMFKKYQMYCEQKLIDIGKLWLYKSPNKWVLNFPTKREWRKKSEYEYIELGLKKFVTSYQSKGITSIAFPKLGCGNGGLDWTVVKAMMEHYLGQLPIDIYIYETALKEKKEFENKNEIKDWLNSNVEDLPYSEFRHDILTILEKKEPTLGEMDQDLLSFWHILKEQGFITIEDNPFVNAFLYELVKDAALQLNYIDYSFLRKADEEYLEALQIVPPISKHAGKRAVL